MDTRFSKFQNLPELMGMFKECADIKTADTIKGLEKLISHIHDIVAEPSKEQKKLIKSLSKRVEEIRKGSVDPKDDNMLCITNDGRKIGLDQRLINPDLPDNPNSKVNMCVDNVAKIYMDTSDKKSTQLIFCDMSTPKSDKRQDRFELYRKGKLDKNTLMSNVGYSMIRRKVGLGKINEEAENAKGINNFNDIKAYMDKSNEEKINCKMEILP